MYLKSIRLDGFKSFAEKTNIVLENNITAIVGPNGSGKSNIVDAIRWVLGEQSIKNLRGSSSMSDIIFNGSLSRNSSSNATVALTFDNSDHYLNTDFSELEIKRVLYKNGECDYYINNSKVRLKDITDLFLDSGAGNDSFNIISQGEVEVIIDSKPIERRAIFEEAAGVLKYKKRKNESLKKLEQTKDNILKVDLVIDELSKTIEPLKEQSMIAKRYLGFKEELKNTEIALMVLDITSLNETYQKLKKEIDELNNQLLDSDTTSKDQVSKLETLKLKSLKLDEEITKTNTNLLDITNQYMSLENERQMYTERKKFMGDAQIVDNNILKLKEELLELDKNIKILDNEIISSRKEVNSWEEKFNKIREEEATLKIKRNTLNNKIYLAEREVMELENKLEILENNISSDLKMPEAVKRILNNPKITGIHNTIGKLMTIDNNYLTAMDTILGNAVNYLVVDDEEVAKDCINYLKDNKLGRATFFPLNIIKARYVEPDIKMRIEKINGFIGIASDLVSYQEKYENIIKNQLGNVIVVENIEAMNLIGRILEHKYRVVTLEGEIMYAGGSITGGTLKNNYGTLKDKKDLEIVKNTLAEKKETLETNKTTLNNLNTEIELVQKNSEDYNRHLIMAQELLREKLDSLNNKSQKRSSLNKELEGSMALKNNDIDEKLMELLEKLNESDAQKNIIARNLENLKNEKFNLTNEINELDKLYREKNTNYNKLQNDLKNKEVNLGKVDIKLDNLLLSLNENYNLTYEKAKLDYILDIPVDTARLKVSSLKNDIDALGEVNTYAIEEYERVKTRYDFLNNQKSDLELASTNLLAIINEMDEIMTQKFKESFQAISQEFSIVFRKLFKGGQGLLKLTDEDNILETGIEIIAEPPGKKLKSIGFLSGGEKTLTAISLLFAILNVKTVPFCILDEVEAALDEANVDGFGKYLQSKKDSSQFILITHKKKTMEYADTLYGITMQESGVSKVVSVKLATSES